MPKICKKCNEKFPYQIKIDNKIRNLGSRKYCLDCSPFGKHNTISLEKDQSKKVCRDCMVEKDISEYYLKSDGYTYCYCKKCTIHRRKKYLHKNKRDAIEYKGGKCKHCSYSKCDAALEFHHTDPTKKDFSISKHRGASIKSIKPELDKCILLCANCHREEHQRLIYETD